MHRVWGFAGLLTLTATACGGVATGERGAPVDGESSPVVSCADIAQLAQRDPLLPGRSSRFHVSPDRSWMGVVSGMLLERVDLPSGQVTPLVDLADSIEPLGTHGALLVTHKDRDDYALSVYDGHQLRLLYTNYCEAHCASPDGRWLLVSHCYGYDTIPTLDLVDVATGARSVFADDWFGKCSFSPSGDWVYFLTRDSSVQANFINLKRTDSDEVPYTLASFPVMGEREAQFVSDDLLVFRTGQFSYGAPAGTQLRGHVPGSGDTSYLIDSDHDPGLFGFEISPDGTSMLTSTPTHSGGAELYLVSLDGKRQQRLSAELYWYWLSENAPRAYNFDATGRWVVFLAAAGDQGPAVASFDLATGMTSKLADNASFQPSPPNEAALLFESPAEGG